VLRQRRATALIAEGSKLTDAAEALGVHRSTVHNWARDPVFKRYVEQLQRQESAERQSRWDGLRVKKLQILEKALEVTDKALEQRNPKAALPIVLRSLQDR